MGTTKLTRKEILAEDPVHQAIIQIVDLVREQGKTIGIVLAGVILVAVSIYFLLQFLDSREAQAQQQLARGIEFYHGTIDANAPDDPYGKGPFPAFKNDAAKYQAASKEFQSVISRYGYSKIAVAARYYLGLIQLRQGQVKEGLRSLETVSNNSKDRTVGYLAKKVLAEHYLEAGNYKGAQEILEAVIRDPQCDLPKDDLSIGLARALASQGKQAEALKVLRSAQEQNPTSMLQSQVLRELTKLQSSPATGTDTTKPAAARP
ncbi:MAG TPA: tetratricopeptide repeat protein [Acidobacteriota bacterium]|nr:tetratricopeptide repeat protein [Acidobacteriota bacterium]